MDHLSVMVNAIKNASMARKPSVEVKHSNECEAVAKVLKDRGFIESVKTFKPKDKVFKMLSIEIGYEDGLPKVTEAKRVSKPGRRIYRGYEEIYKVKGGLGVYVVSTSRGIMSGEEAHKKKLGGEVICQVE